MSPFPTISRVLVLTLGFLAAATAQDPSAPIVIRSVTVIDVAAGAALPGRTVVIEGDRIRQVAPDAEAKVPTGARIVGGSGRFLIPGLFDAHVSRMSGSSWAEGGGSRRVVEGVTGARDVGSPTAASIEIRNAFRRGTRLGPGLLVSGAGIEGPGAASEALVTSPEECRAAVVRLAEAGVDFVAVGSGLGRDAYAAVTAEARARGLLVAGEVPTTFSFDRVLAMRPAVIEHPLTWYLPYLRALGAGDAEDIWDRWGQVTEAARRAFLEKVRASGVAQVASLSLAASWAKDEAPLAGYLKRLQGVLVTVHRAGITLLCGSGLGWALGDFPLQEEMGLWQDAGLPAVDVLRSSTILPAQRFGLADRQGTVEAGKLASLVLLRGDPLEDVRRAKDIEAVCLRGRWLDRAALDRLVAAAPKTALDPKALEDLGAEARRRIAEREKAPRERESGDLPELPGTVVARGRYLETLNGQQSGSEEFLITKDEQGYHLAARQKPAGILVRESMTVMHTGPDFAFRWAEWHLLGEPSVDARYTVDGLKLRADAERGGERQPPQVVDLGEFWLCGCPAHAIHFLTLARAGLAPGENRTFLLAAFGAPTWSVQVNPQTITRQPDEPLTLRDGRTVQARVWSTKMKTPTGAVASRIWTDDHGVVLRAQTRSNLGTIDTVLQE